MTMSYTAMTAAMKEFYDGQTVTKSLIENEPTYAMITKKTNRGGKSYPVPIIRSQSTHSHPGDAIRAALNAAGWPKAKRRAKK